MGVILPSYFGVSTHVSIETVQILDPTPAPHVCYRGVLNPYTFHGSLDVAEKRKERLQKRSTHCPQS